MAVEGTQRIERILVVDDNLTNLELADAMLSSAGYAVTTINTGLEAVRLFQTQPPDLVLLDVVMPGMDGFETCRQMRALPGGAATPIVFVTALGEFGAHHRAMEVGADDFLAKPINRTELLLRVKSLLRLKQLHDALQASNAVASAQRDALLRAEQQKRELTDFIVHDLKNQLGSQLYHAEFLTGQPGLSPMASESAHDILLAGNTMHRMVMNMLDVSMSDDGKLTAKLAPTDLGDLFAEVKRTMTRRAEMNRQHLEVTASLQEMRLLLDRDLVARVLANLVDNALRHTPSGTTVRISDQFVAGGFIEFRVSDDGPGIPREAQSRIFEKFVQVAVAPTAKSASSRGLGLVFCRLAVEAHGGTIWVEEMRPTGACFCFRLPVRQAP